MLKYSGGWKSVHRSEVLDVSSVIKFIKIGSNIAKLIYTDKYNNPGSSGWVNSPINISGNVALYPIRLTKK